MSNSQIRFTQRAIQLAAVALMATSRCLAGAEISQAEKEIHEVIAEQAKAWNDGDIKTFMKHYWNSDQLTFSSGGATTRGWKATLERYENKYSTRQQMGKVEFSDMEFTVLSSDAVLVLGKWSLKREQDNPKGNFTLVFRKLESRWVIIHDHTSLLEPKADAKSEPKDDENNVSQKKQKFRNDPPVATFSIVAYDPDSNEWGIAVQSKFVAVGSLVPWAKAGVGAIATQSFANTTYGPNGLKLLGEGLSAQETLDKLIAQDDLAARRQVGVVDAKGNVATYTGDECLDWAGGKAGNNYVVQGNILESEEVVAAMSSTFESATGDLGERMIASLAAGQERGGDKRGRQSAAVLIVREGAGYGGYNDRYRDLRVDDHPTPIQELKRIYDLHRKVFPAPK